MDHVDVFDLKDRIYVLVQTGMTGFIPIKRSKTVWEGGWSDLEKFHVKSFVEGKIFEKFYPRQMTSREIFPTTSDLHSSDTTPLHWQPWALLALYDGYYLAQTRVWTLVHRSSS
jgi:hypothetical protein